MNANIPFISLAAFLQLTISSIQAFIHHVSIKNLTNRYLKQPFKVYFSSKHPEDITVFNTKQFQIRV